MTARARRTIAEQLRDLIAERRLSGYELAKATGLRRSVVNRFLAGGGLTIDSLDAIAAELGLKLVETARRGSQKRSRNIPNDIPRDRPVITEPAPVITERGDIVFEIPGARYVQAVVTSEPALCGPA